MAPPTTHCELIAAIEIGEGAAERLSAALAAARSVTSVIIAPARGELLQAGTCEPLVRIAQRADAAALLADDARLARTLRADGVHIHPAARIAESYASAREIVGRSLIVGADAGRSRDDAMTLGELGANYVGFGIPDFVGDRDTARARQIDLVAWWAEIFEVPCVALDVTDAAHAAELARAGADFIAVALPTATPPARSAELLREIEVAVAIHENS